MHERSREVLQRGDPDPAADEDGPRHVEPEPVAERSEDRELVAALERRERACAGTDGVEEERELAARCEAERHRTRANGTPCFEHEELAGCAGIDASAFDAHERVRAYGLDRDDLTTLA